VEGDEFGQNSLKFKSQFGGNFNLNWGRIEIPKLLLIFLNNLKNSQIKVVHFDELYNFHFDHFSRFQIDFELGIQIGKGDNFSKCAFSKLL